MKTRTSLVSNSSTSSFICLLPKEIHEEILSEYDGKHPDLFKKIISRCVLSHNLFGKDMIEFSYVNDSGGNTSLGLVGEECIQERTEL